MSIINSYLIHNNGDRPFSVNITDEKSINIYKKDYETNEYNDLILSIEAKKVFIGKSPKNAMTEFSAGWGEYFDGNSILLYLGDNEYIFVGELIYSFKTKTPIVEFISPVGNNDVPYPYAFDNELNYYFLIEYGILKVEDDTKKDDPYMYYYDKLKKIKDSENIDFLIIENEEYNINSNPNPEKNYDDLIKRLGSPIYIKRKNEKKEMNKNEYVELLTDYNKKIGLTSILDIKVIQKRMY